MEKVNQIINQGLISVDEKSQSNVRSPCNESNELTKSSCNGSMSLALLEKYPDPEAFLKSNNPIFQFKVLNEYKRLGEISLDQNVPTLGIVSQTYGFDAAAEWVCIQIQDYLNGCEQQKGTDDEDVLKFAFTIVMIYPYINLYEFCYFISRCRVADFGRMYGVSGINQLGGMFQDFLKKRNASIIACENEKERLRRENAPKPVNGLKAYLEEVKKKADAGDEDAIRILKMHSASLSK